MTVIWGLEIASGIWKELRDLESQLQEQDIPATEAVWDEINLEER